MGDWAPVRIVSCDNFGMGEYYRRYLKLLVQCDYHRVIEVTMKSMTKTNY